MARVTERMKQQRGETSNRWKKNLVDSGLAKRKAFFVREPNLTIVEEALDMANKESQTAAFIEICKAYLESRGER